MNCHIGAAIVIHNTLHRFLVGSGMGTASLKAKLIQHMTSIREEVLYQIFLELYKAYDDLDREICLEILWGYIVVKSVCSARDSG